MKTVDVWCSAFAVICEMLTNNHSVRLTQFFIAIVYVPYCFPYSLHSLFAFIILSISISIFVSVALSIFARAHTRTHTHTQMRCISCDGLSLKTLYYLMTDLFRSIAQIKSFKFGSMCEHIQANLYSLRIHILCVALNEMLFGEIYQIQKKMFLLSYCLLAN